MTRLDRFMDKISPEPNSGCWLWQGAYINSGYGYFRIGSVKDGTRRNVTAHRFILEEVGHSFGPDDQALHKCNNKACVNPEHLYVGSRKDNARDAQLAGVLKGYSSPGASNPNAKLSADEAAYIRECNSRSAAELAKVFSISKTHVYFIKRGKSWKVSDAA